jgi:IPT/TIG domain-containing protein
MLSKLRHAPPVLAQRLLRTRLVAPATALLVCAAAATPAAAQWSRITALPARDVFALSVEQDTIAAATASVVFVSVDGGVHWRPSAPLAGVTSIQAVRLHQGRLFAGTFGQGVFVSSDLGATWQGFNQGLTGGILDSQLFLSSFEVRGDSLVAGTFGAGVFERKLTGTSRWSHFGNVFEPEQASNVNTVALGGTRLIAAGGSNGTVFLRDPGDPEWTPSGLGPRGPIPGVQTHSLLWTGSGWVAGTSSGVFLTATGAEPWTLSSLGFVSILNSALALRCSFAFAAFDEPSGALIALSPDGGLSWTFLEEQPGVFVWALATHDDKLYAARADGLWRHATGIQCGAPFDPAVAVVTPDHGPRTGSTVVITGSGFTGTRAVAFGSQAVAFTVDDDHHITATLGALPTTGFLNVSVTNTSGTGTLTRGFDSFAPPRELGAPCGAPSLTWSGAPTLGQEYIVTTQDLGGASQLLLVDLSKERGGPLVRRLPGFPCAVLIEPDSVLSLGTNPSHEFAIPHFLGLIGQHVRTQAVVLSSPPQVTQVLDATIGE